MIGLERILADLGLVVVLTIGGAVLLMTAAQAATYDFLAAFSRSRRQWDARDFEQRKRAWA